MRHLNQHTQNCLSAFDISVVVEAESTPLVESFHVVLFHLVTFRLKEMIKEFNNK